jgi:hypothetical protein
MAPLDGIIFTPFPARLLIIYHSVIDFQRQEFFKITK